MITLQERAGGHAVPEREPDGAQADSSAGESRPELHQRDQAAELRDGEPGTGDQTVGNTHTLFCSTDLKEKKQYFDSIPLHGASV